MKRLLGKTLKQVVKLVLSGLIGAFILTVVAFVIYLDSQPDLEVWHTAELDEEFTEESGVDNFAEYLALEKRLFAQLEEKVRNRIDPEDRVRFNRYQRGSRSDPARWPRDWNRTFELPVETPRAGVLLLHGLSDSPYSLHNAAERLHAAGAWVVGLRLPGHGTAPSGLTSVSWEDWAAAVRLAVKHVKAKVGDRPLRLVGYSNGGALAVHYAITTVEDEGLPRPSSLVLMSPEIGITPAAAIAIWQERLGRWLGLDKLQWSSVLPEYDPFKYQSFAVNAGAQAHRITEEIDDRLQELKERGAMGRFPPVLVFQSAVDATVRVTDLITVLMQRLEANGSELVIFDVNRTREVTHLLKDDPSDHLRELLQKGELPFTLSVVTNENDTSIGVEVHTRAPGTKEMQKSPLGIAWPTGLYSLGHVALPFPSTDPLYGGEAKSSPGVRLGRMVLHGEKGALRIPAADMLRVHWNPFYSYVERRFLDFLDLE